MLKTSRGTGLVAALMGATFLLMVLTNPRAELLRRPDVLKLVASRHVFWGSASLA